YGRRAAAEDPYPGHIHRRRRGGQRCREDAEHKEDATPDAAEPHSDLLFGLLWMMPTFEQPNADAQPLPEAGATQERTLEGVGCSGLLGQALVISSRPARRPSRLGSHDAPAACPPEDGTGVLWGAFPKTPVQKCLLACLSACLRILIGVNITGRRGKVANILRLGESAKNLPAPVEHC